MSDLRQKRREERSAGNKEGLVAVQQPDGSIKHLERYEWEGQVNNGDAEEPTE